MGRELNEELRAKVQRQEATQDEADALARRLVRSKRRQINGRAF